MRWALIVLFVLGGVTGTVRGELRVLPSVEWLACSADAIIVAESLQAIPAEGPPSGLEEVCVKVVETIKGAVRGDVRMLLRPHQLDRLRKVAEQGDAATRWLCFLSRGKDRPHDARLEQGRWLLAADDLVISIFCLSMPPEYAVSKDMTILSDPGKLVNLTRVWAGANFVHSLGRDADFFSPLEREFGGSFIVIVPAEPHYLAEFLRLADSPKRHERQQAASELGKYPGAETVKVLNRLLEDRAENTSHFAADIISEVTYPVRQAAIRSLRMLEQPVPDLPLGRPVTEAERTELRLRYWRESLMRGLPAGWRLESVTDGQTRQIERWPETLVLADCRHEATSTYGRLVLFPASWRDRPLPTGSVLGWNTGQGARVFVWVGEIRAEERAALVRHFSLAPLPDLKFGR